MNRIENYDFFTICSNYNSIFDEGKKNKTRGYANTALASIPLEMRTTDFLEYLTIILEAMPLVYLDNGKVSASGIFNKLKEPDLVIPMPSGEVTGRTMMGILRFIHALNRGSFFKGKITQSKQANLASLTPIPMYAVKRSRGIQYEDWDKTDLYLRYMLGKSLMPLLGKTVQENFVLDTSIYTQNPFNNIDMINKYRKERLTLKSKNVLITQSLIGWGKGYANLTISADDNLANQPIKYHGVVIIMWLQTWLANAELRIPEAMILDPINWDNIPEALDEQDWVATIPKTVEVTTKEISKEPWD